MTIIWQAASTILAGALTTAGIAYPSLARTKPGWKLGKWSGGPGLSIWYLLGALNYLAAMAHLWGWGGFLTAIPVAFVGAFIATSIIRQHVQLVALFGPILAFVGYVMVSN